MSRIVQEKFLIDAPPNPNDNAEGRGWVMARSARVKKGVPGKDMPGTSDAQNQCFFNSLPPGSDIADQEMSDIRQMPYGGNLGSGTQVTTDVTATSLREGFDRKPLRPTDDMYTREHNDAFYDSISVDGVEGYVERNNMCDRM